MEIKNGYSDSIQGKVRVYLDLWAVLQISPCKLSYKR